MGTGLDWDDWIGQEEPPEEVEEFAPLPPPVDDEAQLRQLQKDNELDKKIAEAKKDSTVNLPDLRTVLDYPEELELEPELIQGVLRRGHKLMITAASKAGKSFLMIELALCIAAGKRFLGKFLCARSKVLYINLEISELSFMNRINQVAKKYGLEKEDYAENLKILHLRGESIPLKAMSGALIAKMIEEYKNTRESFSAVIFDPIYKITAGEENSAKDVGDFCNQLDKIAKQANCSPIYSHHHSKGDQGFKKAQDRGSGSGVFARDADALIDMVELEIKPETREALKNDFGVRMWTGMLDEVSDNWRDDMFPSATEQATALADMYRSITHNTPYQMKRDKEAIDGGFEKFMDEMTPMRVEFTLREFKTPKPINIFFVPPVHILDENDILAMADYECHIQGMKKETAVAKKKNGLVAFREVLDSIINEKGEATYMDIQMVLDMDKKTIQKRLKDLENIYEIIIGGGSQKTVIRYRD